MDENYNDEYWRKINIEQEQENILFQMRKKGCPEKYWNISIDDFSSGTIKLIKRITQNKEWKKNSGLFITGKKGTGKTHLLCSIAKELIKRHIGYFCFITVDDLLSEIKDSYNIKSEEEKMTELQLRKYYSEEMNYLFLDDFGAEQITDWSLRYLDSLINARYGNLKPTFFSTNLTFKQVEKIYGSRIVSRIEEVCHLIQLDGKDRRKEKGKNNRL